MKAKSIVGNSTTAIKTALDKTMTGGFRPTLAIAFASVVQDINAISQVLDERGIAVFGATTNGEFTDEEINKGSAAILLLDMKEAHFQLYFQEYPEGNYRSVSRLIAKKALNKFQNPAFLIGLSGAAADGEEILRGLEEVVGKDIVAFGGAAGDDYSFTETFIFTNDKVCNNGILCLVLDTDKVEINGIATCGWKSVGTEKTVTKSIGNHVFTVDNMPVLDITAKYGGLENVNPDNANLLMEIAENFPLQLQREKGDPVMRPGLMVDWSDRSFYTGGTVPQGSKVRFSLPPDWDVMDRVVQAVKDLKETKMPGADAVVVFSCAGRILSLGPLMTQELDGIKNVWNVPMAGMFSNAELGRATGGNLEMHNLTTCCVAIKEKPNHRDSLR